MNLKNKTNEELIELLDYYDAQTSIHNNKQMVLKIQINSLNI